MSKWIIPIKNEQFLKISTQTKGEKVNAKTSTTLSPPNPNPPSQPPQTKKHHPAKRSHYKLRVR